MRSRGIQQATVPLICLAFGLAGWLGALKNHRLSPFVGLAYVLLAIGAFLLPSISSNRTLKRATPLIAGIGVALAVWSINQPAIQINDKLLVIGLCVFVFAAVIDIYLTQFGRLLAYGCGLLFLWASYALYYLSPAYAALYVGDGSRYAPLAISLLATAVTVFILLTGIQRRPKPATQVNSPPEE
ncbi:MAG: hypothetical protein JSS72_07045 [Armatimonadetes bacterium]|nr:hypothetical protein [Armatimonadota bacterium]